MILNLIEQFGLKHAKPVGTPVAEVVYSPEDFNPLTPEDTSRFQTLAGSLLWISRCTRPDIGFAVHHMTRRTHALRLCNLKLGQTLVALSTYGRRIYGSCT
jgi:hypothetical protein